MNEDRVMRVNLRAPMTLPEIARQYEVPLNELRMLNPDAGSEKLHTYLISLRLLKQSRPQPGPAARPPTPTQIARGVEPLLAQHTVQPPAMSIGDAIGILEPLVDGVGSPLKASGQPDVQDAAIAMLKYRYTPVDLDAINGVLNDEGTVRAVQAALGLIPYLDAAHERVLLNEVLFNFAHPNTHLFLGPGIVELVAPGKMEALLLRHARSDNELHVNNALHLPYYLYGRTPDFRRTDSDRREFLAIVEELRSTGGLNPVVRAALESFRLPVDRER